MHIVLIVSLIASTILTAYFISKLIDKSFDLAGSSLRMTKSKLNTAIADFGADENSEFVWIPQAIIVAMLLWAILPFNQYGYYELLRWVSSGVFSFLAWQAYRQRKFDWIWVLGITAGIYNPVLIVHLTRPVWAIVNLITIVVAIRSVFVLRRIRSDV